MSYKTSKRSDSMAGGDIGQRSFEKLSSAAKESEIEDNYSYEKI